MTKIIKASVVEVRSSKNVIFEGASKLTLGEDLYFGLRRLLGLDL